MLFVVVSTYNMKQGRWLASTSSHKSLSHHKATVRIAIKTPQPDKFPIMSTRLGDRTVILGGEISNNIRFSAIFPYAWLFWCQWPLERDHDHVTFCTLIGQFYRKIHCLTGEFHVKFHAKNWSPVEFTSLAMNFSWIACQRKTTFPARKPFQSQLSRASE